MEFLGPIYHPNNNHEISVQVMRHFVNCQKNTCDTWPPEFHDEFSSLITKRVYTKGSLAHMLFYTSISSTVMENVQPLPPIRETVLNRSLRGYIIEDLKKYLSPTVADVCYICSKSKSLKMNSFIISSEKGE